MMADARLESYYSLERQEKAAALRAQALELLEAAPDGLAAFEVASALGLGHRQDIAPRLTELEEVGRLIKTKRTRINPASGHLGNVYLAIPRTPVQEAQP